MKILYITDGEAVMSDDDRPGIEVRSKLERWLDSPTVHRASLRGMAQRLDDDFYVATQLESHAALIGRQKK